MSVFCMLMLIIVLLTMGYSIVLYRASVNIEDKMRYATMIFVCLVVIMIMLWVLC